MNGIPEVLIKATFVLAAGWVVAGCARTANAATRHTIWALTLAGALALPLGIFAIPAWRVGILEHASGQQQAIGPTESATPQTAPSRTSDIPSLPVSAGRPVGTNSVADVTGWRALREAAADGLWVPVIWVAGVLAMLLWMIAGRAALHRLARGAEMLVSPAWQGLLDDERRRAGVKNPVALLSSEGVSTPLTWGIRSPVILLPAESAAWQDEHRTVVLRHEIAHIARADTLTQMLGAVTCAVYWFHPLVWIAARGLRAEQERACDERVLSSGTPAVEYAAHLLEVARSARALGSQGLVSLAMARPSQLEGRLLAVLNASPERRGITTTTKWIGLASAVVAFVALLAFTPISRGAALNRVIVPTIIATQFVPARSAVPATRSPVATARNLVDSTFEKSVDAREGGTLVLDLETGASLTIAGWDQPRVRVSGTLGGRDWRDTDVRLEGRESGARLTTKYVGRSGSQSTSHHFDIRVPRRFSVEISSAGGGVTISGVDGVFTGTTGGGAIRIENASGRADISTGGGNIRVNGSSLSGSVSTGGGTVFIQGGAGRLKGHSGSGPIVYSGSGGTSVSSAGISVDDDNNVTVSSGANVTIDDRTGQIRETSSGRIIYRKSGGGVHLAEAMSGADIRTGGGGVTIGRSAGDVRVTTGGGDISVGRSAGDVRVNTGGGDITLGPVAGSADASTGRGDVMITLTGSDGHSVDVRSGTGKVVLNLPANLSAVLELETAYTENFGRRTRIESDWKLSPSESADWDDSYGTPRKFVRARQTIGRGGNVIRVKTVNGDIIVQRSR
jgi:beta-lactamase regulating signal transducer with metallopeptidase domain